MSALLGLLIGSAVSGIANVASTALTNSSNRSISESTNAANLKLAAQQNAFNYHMWQQNNEYNTPLQQARRFREAGLSDSAAVQAVSGVPSSPIQSADLANQQNGSFNQPLDFSGLNIVGLLRELMALKKESAEADIAETSADWKETLLVDEHDLNDALLKINKQSLKESVESWDYRLGGYKADMLLKKQQQKESRALTEKYKADKKLILQNFDFLTKMNDLKINEVSAKISHIKEQIKTEVATQKHLDSQSRLANAEAGQVSQYTKNLTASEEGTRFDNRVKEVQAILAEFGQPQTYAGRLATLLLRSKLDSKEDFEGLLKSLRGTVATMQHHFSYKGATNLEKQIFRYVLSPVADSEKNSIFSRGLFGDIDDLSDIPLDALSRATSK